MKKYNTPIDEIFKNCFLDYASYVVLERAIPAVEDGLKPVQRRILHAMHITEDSRFHKVANVIGNAMQYHPHGDASIGDALVNIGQKNILVETQGNWGDIRTGDSAAAPRYIEARLSNFAKETCFSPNVTEWKDSYDGRKKEPIRLPIKFPLLLAQGVEGIAVGLSTKILPHNFCEIIEATIAYLRNQPFTLFPDFPTAAQVDISQYKEGKRGAKVKVRATIKKVDKNTLEITEIPYGTNTSSLIQSILKANENGKIKIKKVIDSTAKEVQITLHLRPEQDLKIVINALYVFTDCETTLYPNACVIVKKQPQFLSVNDILKISVDHTVELLKRELEIQKKNLQEKIFFLSLEQIFIEYKIYRRIENCQTWEDVLATIEQGIQKYTTSLYRPVVQEDLVKLTEIKIKRISKYDSQESENRKEALTKDLEKVERNLKYLVRYAINYFKKLLTKYGTQFPRKTQISNFESITTHEVATNNSKLFVDKKEGFIGSALKDAEWVCDCSDIDNVIVFCKNGTFVVTKIDKKKFIEKGILYANILRADNRIYQMIYIDRTTGISRVKRFGVKGITRDKIYDLTLDFQKCKVLYFSVLESQSAEAVDILLHPQCKAVNKRLIFELGSVEVKGRQSQGNVITKYPIKSVKKSKRVVNNSKSLL